VGQKRHVKRHGRKHRNSEGGTNTKGSVNKQWEVWEGARKAWPGRAEGASAREGKERKAGQGPDRWEARAAASQRRPLYL
jgi:hypothetical protein